MPVPLPVLPSAQQLAVLEQLLWQGGSSSKHGSGFWQWVLKAALGLVELQLDDCRCQYVVQGQLGPQAQQQQQQQQRDGIAFSIRSLVLAPGSPITTTAVAGSMARGAAATAAAEGKCLPTGE